MSKSRKKARDDLAFSVNKFSHSPIHRHTKQPITVGKGLVIIFLFLLFLIQWKNVRPAFANDTGDVTPAKDISDSWANFRGPGAYGHAGHANPPLNWDVKEGKNVLWKVSVPKPGMSSPVVWENRIFLTGADKTSRQIYCFDTESGIMLWQHDATGIRGSPSNDKLPNVMETSGLAASTATTNGRFVAAIFATGDLVCLNMEGKLIWARNLGVPKNQYGHASSLISHNDLLFVQYDQEKDSKLLALDMASGKNIWQVKRSVVSWSSPILVDNKGRMELILTNCEAVDSYDPETGKLLWNIKCLTGEVAPSAAYADGVVYVANEYAAATAIEIANHDSKPKVLWQWADTLPDVSSPVAGKEYFIVPSGFGVITCLDAKTGKIFWEQEFDKGFYSSPIIVNNRVYIMDRSGGMHIFKLDNKYKQLGKSEIGEQAGATPAFIDNRIYIRGLTHLFCIEEQK